MQPAIRGATRKDGPALMAIYRRAALSVQVDRPALLAHPASLVWSWPRDAARVRLIDGGEDGPLAFATTLLPPGSARAEIDDLFVEPLQQRTGLGARLVEDAAQLAQDAGFDELTVTAGSAAAFYLRQGFFVVERVDTMHAPALRLVRPLTG